MQETQVWALGHGDSLQKGMATHYSIILLFFSILFLFEQWLSSEGYFTTKETFGDFWRHLRFSQCGEGGLQHLLERPYVCMCDKTCICTYLKLQKLFWICWFYGGSSGTNVEANRWANPAVCGQAPNKAPPGPGHMSAAWRPGDPAPESLHLWLPSPEGVPASHGVSAPSSRDSLSSNKLRDAVPQHRPTAGPPGPRCRTLTHSCGPHPAGTLFRLVPYLHPAAEHHLEHKECSVCVCEREGWLTETKQETDDCWWVNTAKPL